MILSYATKAGQAGLQANVASGSGQTMLAPLDLLKNNIFRAATYSASMYSDELRAALTLLAEDAREITHVLKVDRDAHISIGDYVQFQLKGRPALCKRAKKITVSEYQMEVELGKRVKSATEILKDKSALLTLLGSIQRVWKHSTSGNVTDTSNLRRRFSLKSYQIDSDQAARFIMGINISSYQSSLSGVDDDVHDHGGTTGSGDPVYHSTIGDHADYDHTSNAGTHDHTSISVTGFSEDATGSNPKRVTRGATWSVTMPSTYDEEYWEYFYDVMWKNFSEGGCYLGCNWPTTGAKHSANGNHNHPSADLRMYYYDEYGWNIDWGWMHGHLATTLESDDIYASDITHYHELTFSLATSGTHTHIDHPAETRAGSDMHAGDTAPVEEDTTEPDLLYDVTEIDDSGSPFSLRIFINSVELTESPWENLSVGDRVPDIDITNYIYSDAVNLLEFEVDPYLHSDIVRVQLSIDIDGKFYIR